MNDDTAWPATPTGIDRNGTTLTADPVEFRIAVLDWSRIEADLESRGHALTGPVLTMAECISLGTCYDGTTEFRSRVVMARHGFGLGEYQYYAYPLPTLIQDLRTALYPRLVAVANRWQIAAGRAAGFPSRHPAFLDQCHSAGQTRPTPLQLRYGVGDYNCLHQDLYGDLFFPLQAAFLLSRPNMDFQGGEFVLTEQRPRMQSRAEVVSLGRGRQ